MCILPRIQFYIVCFYFLEFNSCLIWKVNEKSIYNFSCLEKISKKYFNDKRINIYFQNSSDKSNEIAKLFSNWTVEIYDVNMKQGSTFSPIEIFKSKMTLLIIENMNEFPGFLLELRKNPTWNARSKVLIISKEDDENSAKEIFKNLWSITRASNFVLVLNENCKKFYTWKPFQKNDCDRVSNLTILNFSDMYKEPDFGDLNGCNVSVTTSNLPPYVIYSNLNHKHGQGIEVTIMTNIAENLNANIHYVPNKTSNWNEKSENETYWRSQGVSGMLIRNEADIAFSCLILTYERFMKADGLISHIEDEIVWFVPTPRPTVLVQSLLFAFDKTMWGLIGTSLILITGLLYFQEKSISWFYANIKIFSAFINMPIKTKAKVPPILTYIIAIHATTIYQSWMSINLMIERTEKPIETLKEAADADLFAYLVPSLADYYNKTDFDVWEKILRPGHFAYNELLYSRLEEIANNKTAILLFPKLPALHHSGKYHRDENGVLKVNYLKPRFLSAKLTFYLSPGNPLTPIFNRKMTQLVESGLITYWINAYVDVKITFSHKINFEEGSKPGTMKNFQAGFYYIAIIYTLTFFVFLCEVIFGYFQRKYK